MNRYGTEQQHSELRRNDDRKYVIVHSIDAFQRRLKQNARSKQNAALRCRGELRNYASES